MTTSSSSSSSSSSSPSSSSSSSSAASAQTSSSSASASSSSSTETFPVRKSSLKASKALVQSRLAESYASRLALHTSRSDTLLRVALLPPSFTAAAFLSLLGSEWAGEEENAATVLAASLVAALLLNGIWLMGMTCSVHWHNTEVYRMSKALTAVQYCLLAEDDVGARLTVVSEGVETKRQVKRGKGAFCKPDWQQELGMIALMGLGPILIGLALALVGNLDGENDGVTLAHLWFNVGGFVLAVVGILVFFAVWNLHLRIIPIVHRELTEDEAAGGGEDESRSLAKKPAGSESCEEAAFLQFLGQSHERVVTHAGLTDERTLSIYTYVLATAVALMAVVVNMVTSIDDARFEVAVVASRVISGGFSVACAFIAVTLLFNTRQVAFFRDQAFAIEQEMTRIAADDASSMATALDVVKRRVGDLSMERDGMRAISSDAGAFIVMLAGVASAVFCCMWDTVFRPDSISGGAKAGEICGCVGVVIVNIALLLKFAAKRAKVKSE